MTKQISEGLLGLGGAESVSIYLLDLDRAQCSLVSAADSSDWIRDSKAGINALYRTGPFWRKSLLPACQPIGWWRTKASVPVNEPYIGRMERLRFSCCR